MTKEEELELLRKCGDELSKHTAHISLGAALIMAFPGMPGRIHAVSNLPERRMYELVRLYLNEVPDENKRRYDSIWLLVKGTEVDQVATERVIASFSSQEKALAARMQQKDDAKTWWSIEEVEVDASDFVV